MYNRIVIDIDCYVCLYPNISKFVCGRFGDRLVCIPCAHTAKLLADDSAMLS